VSMNSAVGSINPPSVLQITHRLYHRTPNSYQILRHLPVARVDDLGYPAPGVRVRVDLLLRLHAQQGEDAQQLSDAGCPLIARLPYQPL
jgi:hypothetical protein